MIVHIHRDFASEFTVFRLYCPFVIYHDPICMLFFLVIAFTLVYICSLFLNIGIPSTPMPCKLANSGTQNILSLPDFLFCVRFLSLDQKSFLICFTINLFAK